MDDVFDATKKFFGYDINRKILFFPLIGRGWNQDGDNF